MLSKKICLIEDEDFIRDLYKRQLDQNGFSTDAFSNGTTGLGAIQKNEYDLILLDIMLPDMNGLEILKKIKEAGLAKKVPIVFLTNLGQDTIIQEGYKLGAVGYLIKASLTPDQLIQEIMNFLNKPIQPSVSPPQT